MTDVPSPGGGRRAGPSRRSSAADGSGRLSRTDHARMRMELRATAFETVEMAAARAEEMVSARRPDSTVRGVTIVVIDFIDLELEHAFRAAGLIRRCRTSGAWELVRSWGGSEDDVELGEAMGAMVACIVGKEFGGDLRVRVISLIDRT